MAEFSWGPEFLRITETVLSAYARAGDSAGVLAAQAAWLQQLESEAATRGSRGRDLPPTDDEEEGDGEERTESAAGDTAGNSTMDALRGLSLGGAAAVELRGLSLGGATAVELGGGGPQVEAASAPVPAAAIDAAARDIGATLPAAAAFDAVG